MIIMVTEGKVCKMEYSFSPLVDEKSRILILGSLPGLKSLELNQYYAHPQNRFWKIMFAIFDTPLSNDYSIRCSLLLSNHIALWDVLKCADRKGSSDGNIRNQIPNDIPLLLKEHPNISFIIYNGSCAFSNFKKYFGQPPLRYKHLLSTSPACAGRDHERFEMWERALTLLR